MNPKFIGFFHFSDTKEIDSWIDLEVVENCGQDRPIPGEDTIIDTRVIRTWKAKRDDGEPINFLKLREMSPLLRRLSEGEWISLCDQIPGGVVPKSRLV